MSEAPVRQRIKARKQAGRSIPEAVAIRAERLSGIARAGADLVLELPPSSPIRKGFVAKFAELSYAAASRGDMDMDAIVYADDVVLAFPGASPLGTDRFVGRTEIRAAFSDWRGVWSEYDKQPNEVIDAGDRIIVLGRESATGGTSGVEVSQPVATVFFVRDGAIVRIEEHFDWAAPLEAAGLSE